MDLVGAIVFRAHPGAGFDAGYFQAGAGEGEHGYSAGGA